MAIECSAWGLIVVLVLVPLVAVVCMVALVLEWLLRMLIICFTAEPAYVAKGILLLNPWALMAHQTIRRMQMGEDTSPRAIADAFEKIAEEYETYTIQAFRAETWNLGFNLGLHAVSIYATYEHLQGDHALLPEVIFTALFGAILLTLNVPGLLRTLPTVSATPTAERVRSAIRQLDVFTICIGRRRIGLSEALSEFVLSEQRAGGGVDGELTRFSGQQLLTGDPARAALGVVAILGVPDRQLWTGMGQGMDAIVAEWERHGTDLDKECLDYVLRQTAGSNQRPWPHSGGHLMDIFDVGADEIAKDARAGQPLAYFVEHPSARAAGLLPEHVLCLRLYTTACFRSINGPLRGAGQEGGTPHPLPVTVMFLTDGIKRLRAAAPDAQHSADAGSELKSPHASEGQSLYRGMRNLELPSTFREGGGTEFAPMSTSRDIRVALAYSGKAEQRLIFKVLTSSFIDRGADLTFLSAFPQEVEILYPPLTLLLPTGREDRVSIAGIKYSIVEVEPRFAT